MARNLMPWTGMASLKEEMDRLFDRFGAPRWPEVFGAGEWSPSLDVSETKDALVVKLEVPGLDPADITLELQENILTIKGEKKQEKEEKDERYHRVERTYGTFARSVRLPVAVDGARVVATFKNGLLSVTLAKTAAAKANPIPIKAE